MGRLRLLAANLTLMMVLAGCAAPTRPPGDLGTCYQVEPLKGGAMKYNPLASKQPDLEHCAAALEAMRVRFLSMGGSRQDIYGAYQGNFIFIEREGIFTAPSLEAHRYLALVRTGDGRLAIPAAVSR